MSLLTSPIPRSPPWPSLTFCCDPWPLPHSPDPQTVQGAPLSHRFNDLMTSKPKCNCLRSLRRGVSIRACWRSTSSTCVCMLCVCCVCVCRSVACHRLCCHVSVHLHKEKGAEWSFWGVFASYSKCKTKPLICLMPAFKSWLNNHI